MTRLTFFVLYLAALLLGSSTAWSQDPAPISMWSVSEVPEDKNDQKFLIEGPWSIGDPVHETLTLQALIDGGILPNNTTSKDKTAAQFIRGVLWNDDPCAQLLTENPFIPLQPSTGWIWYIDFQMAKRQAKTGDVTKDMTCPLLGRSHFGDLQFLHSMADRDGITPATTVAHILAWANVVYRIALGDIDPRIPLKTDPVANTFLSSVAEMSAMQLLRAQTESETRARAFGTLLHIVQDSYARGHVRRVSASAEHPAEIIQFLSYVNQNPDKHAHDDSWKNGTSDLERTLKIPGANEALAASSELVRRYKNKQPWPEVELYLKNNTFLVRADAIDSGPGEYQ